MNVQKMSCPSCGASISVAEDLDRLTCAFCGSTLTVQRGEGYAALKMGEKIGQAIQDSSLQTQGTIREGAQVTQLELRRLQINQDITTAQLQLYNVQAEIRSLEREKVTATSKQQLRELRHQEASIKSRIDALQAALRPASDSGGASTVSGLSSKAKQTMQRKGIGGKLVVGCGGLLALSFICALTIGIWAYLGIPVALILALVFYKSSTFRNGAYNHFPWLRRIPGFGAGDPQRMAIATLVYILPISLFLLAAMVWGQQKPPSPVTVQVPTQTVSISPTLAPPTPLTATPTSVPPTSTKPGIRYVSAGGEGVYIRSRPDREARVTAWPDGTEMIVLDQEGDWYKVQAPDGYTGYVPAEYLALVRPSPSTQVVTPTKTLSPASTPVPITKLTVPAGELSKYKDSYSNYKEVFVYKKNGTLDERPNDLEELCLDWPFYRQKILEYTQAGNNEKAAQARTDFQKINVWLSEYNEDDVQTMFSIIEKRGGR